MISTCTVLCAFKCRLNTVVDSKGLQYSESNEKKKKTTNLLNGINVFFEEKTNFSEPLVEDNRFSMLRNENEKKNTTFSNGSVCFWIYQRVFVIQKSWAFSICFVIIVQILTKSVRCDDRHSNSNRNNNQNQSHFNCSELKMNALMSFYEFIPNSIRAFSMKIM